jgi:hypothetical protein
MTTINPYATNDYNLTYSTKYTSLAALVADDSKTLGSAKLRLSKKLEESDKLQTGRLKTLNSSWTPLVDQTANKEVYKINNNVLQHI